MNRFLVNALMLVGIFFLPTWLIIIIACYVLFFAPFHWYELVGFALLLDVIEGSLKVSQFIHLPVNTIFGVVLLLVAFFVRKRMSFHV